MRHVFIGWDSRETQAYSVCKHSMTRRSSVPLDIFPLMSQSLRLKKIFSREIEGSVDKLDGKPTSTEFSFTRFLVPEICRMNNVQDWVLFCDCDFLFLDDVEKLWPVAGQDSEFAVKVVKHKYTPEESTKMENKIQSPYPRKLWSSAVLWNTQHLSNEKLTSELVNTESGRYLHNFSWLSDEEIGEIDERWNWVPGVSPTTREVYWDRPSAVHFSLGVPDMKGYEDCDFAESWKRELAHFQGPRPFRETIRL